MSNLTRRNFIKLAVTTTAASTFGFPFITRGAAKRVVVIGGGAGGTIAAKYIKMADPAIEVTLVEQNPNYYTCFLSNEVISGERTLDSLKFSYSGLIKHGVKIVAKMATAIDAVAHKVTVEGGAALEYDRLVVSPGIDLKYDAIDGYSEAITQKLPHAWKAGPQTELLRKQLVAMKNGGTVIISAPADPYRCPPGPYERASQIAHYLKQHKPKSKVIILDAKEKFSKQALFVEGWTALYGFGTPDSMISWLPASAEGKVTRVDPNTMTVYSGELDTVTHGDIINIIPPQMAGKIAQTSGLTDEKGWCPVNKATFESTKAKDVHVIGDACIAADMPKSAYSANSQAKLAAAVVVAALNGGEMPTPTYLNTCYSLLNPDWGISVAGVYRLEGATIKSVEGSGGVSPAKASAAQRKREVAYAYSWYKNITQDMFG
ncbi:Sulfide dehydrogenase (flavocytochrome c) flavoprotein chain [Gammaproteobacteria bacterium]